MDATQPAPATEQPQPGGSARGCLRILASGVLLLVLLGAVGAFAWYRLEISPIKSSEPYRMAFEHLRTDPEVKKALGEPIEEVFWPLPSSTENLKGDRGTADLTFEVAGPKNRAVVQAKARMIDRKWGLGSLVVTCAESGQRMNLDTREVGQQEEAPPWKPGG